MQKVYLAMPSLSGRPDIATQSALIDTLVALKGAGVSVHFKPVVGDSIISRTRNFFVSDFLASDCTDLIMIDDDLWWEPGAVQRLLSHPCDLVGGVYPKRQDDLEFPVRRSPGAKVDLSTGLLEVELLPTGFLRMTRACLERMVQAYSHLRYHDRHLPNRQFYALFWVELGKGLDGDIEDLEVWGEDFTFCKRWRDIGGKVWLDTLIEFKHIGRKAWGGRYADSMPIAAMFEHVDVDQRPANDTAKPRVRVKAGAAWNETYG